MAVTPAVPDQGPAPRAPSRPAKTVPGEQLAPVAASGRPSPLTSAIPICRPTPETLLLDVGGNPKIWALLPQSQRGHRPKL